MAATLDLEAIANLQDNISAKLGTITTNMDHLGTATAAASRSASDSLEAFGAKSTQVGSVLSVGLTAPILAIGAAAVVSSTQFNEGMANVASLIPGNIAHVNELKSAVQEMSISTGQSTKDLATGLYQTLSAFGDTAETAHILEINARAASAGVASTAEAIALTSAVTKGYGDTTAESVQHVSDLALLTVRLGQTTFPQLAGAMGLVTPLAQGLAVSQEELFAVMATGTGVTGEAAQVATQLRGIMQSLMAPTSDMTNLMHAYGFANGEAMVAGLGLEGTIQAIVDNAAEGEVPLQKFIGSIEGQTLAMALAGPLAGDYATKLEAMSDAAGTTEVAFNEIANGINAQGFAWDQFQNKMTVTAQKLGDSMAPALGIVLDKLMGLADGLAIAVQWFGQLDPGLQLAILAFLGFLAAVGPVLIIVGQIASAIGILLPVVAGLGPAFAAAGGALTLLLGPIGLIILAVAALAAGLIIAYNTSEDFRNIVDGMLGTISHAQAAFAAWIDEGLNPLDAALQTLSGVINDTFGPDAAAQFDQFTQTVGDMFSAVGSYVQDGMAAIQEMVGSGLTAILGFWTEHGSTVVSIVEGIWTIISTLVEAQIGVVAGLLHAGMLLLSGDWQGAWDMVVGTLTDAWNLIATSLGGVLANLITWGGEVVAAVHEAWDRVTPAILDALAAVLPALATWAGEVMSALGTLASTVGSAALSIGSEIVQGIVHGVQAGAGAVAGAVGSMVQGGIDRAKQVLGIPGGSSKAYKDLGEESTEGYTHGIEAGKAAALTAIDGFMHELISNASNFKAEFNATGADLASKLMMGIADNTAAKGADVAKALDKLVTDLRTSGVVEWREMGDDLAGAVHDALIDGTPEAAAAAMALIGAASDVIKQANSPSGIWGQHLHELASLAGLQAEMGVAGAKVGQALIDGLTDPSKKNLNALASSVSALIANAEAKGVTDAIRLGQRLDEVITEALANLDDPETLAMLAEEARNIVATLGTGLDAIGPAAKAALAQIKLDEEAEKLAAKFEAVFVTVGQRIHTAIFAQLPFADQVTELFAQADAAGLAAIADFSLHNVDALGQAVAALINVIKTGLPPDQAAEAYRALFDAMEQVRTDRTPEAVANLQATMDAIRAPIVAAATTLPAAVHTTFEAVTAAMEDKQWAARAGTSGVALFTAVTNEVHAQTPATVAATINAMVQISDAFKNLSPADQAEHMATVWAHVNAALASGSTDDMIALRAWIADYIGAMNGLSGMTFTGPTVGAPVTPFNPNSPSTSVPSVPSTPAGAGKHWVLNPSGTTWIAVPLGTTGGGGGGTGGSGGGGKRADDPAPGGQAGVSTLTGLVLTPEEIARKARDDAAAAAYYAGLNQQLLDAAKARGGGGGGMIDTMTIPYWLSYYAGLGITGTNNGHVFADVRTLTNDINNTPNTIGGPGPVQISAASSLLYKLYDIIDTYNPQITGVPLMARGGIAREPTLGIFGEAGPEALVPLPSGGLFTEHDANLFGEAVGRVINEASATRNPFGLGTDTRTGLAELHAMIDEVRVVTPVLHDMIDETRTVPSVFHEMVDEVRTVAPTIHGMIDEAQRQSDAAAAVAKANELAASVKARELADSVQRSIDAAAKAAELADSMRRADLDKIASDLRPITAPGTIGTVGPSVAPPVIPIGSDNRTPIIPIGSDTRNAGATRGGGGGVPVAPNIFNDLAAMGLLMQLAELSPLAYANLQANPDISLDQLRQMVSYYQSKKPAAIPWMYDQPTAPTADALIASFRSNLQRAQANGDQPGIARWQQALTDMGVTLPPGFAGGARVSSPTYALIGESGPEWVIPESKMGGHGGGLGRSITRDEARMIGEELAAALQRSGPLTAEIGERTLFRKITEAQRTGQLSPVGV